MPTRRTMLRKLDVPAVEAAIARAEARTSAELRVSIAPWFWGSVRRTAERAFARLGLTNTRERNGVLIFVAPARRSFVVLGDEGIHARVGQVYWDQLVAELGRAFRSGNYTQGLIRVVERLGERLAESFPADASDNPDELSNAIDGA
ncbi:TPM domain-containing protein [Nannocystaceae bacterium ST9]